MWLPVSRGEQYYHALLRRQNWQTFSRDAFDPEEQMETLQSQRATAPPPWAQPRPEIEAAWARFEKLG